MSQELPLKSAYPEASAKQIKQAILDGADSSYCANDSSDTRYYMNSNQVHDVTSKHGFLDLEKALEKLAAALGRTIDDTPADDTPVDDTPADDTPADDTPVDDTPADDTPADDMPDETLQGDIRPSWASSMSITEFYSLLFSGSRTFKPGTMTDTKSRYDANNPVKFKLSSPLANDTRIYVRMTPSAYKGSVSAAAADTVNAVMIASGDIIEVRPGKLYNPYRTSRLVEIYDGSYDIKLTTAGSSASDKNAIAKQFILR